MNKAAIDWKAMRAAMAEKKAIRSKPVAAYSQLFLAAAFRSSFSQEEIGELLPAENSNTTEFRQEVAKLVEASEVVHDKGTLKWQLKSEDRQKVMQSLGSIGAMKPYLPQGPQTGSNTLQRMLTNYVEGTAKSLEDQTLKELGATYQIAGWLHEVDPVGIPDQLEVQAKLRIKELTAPFRKLTAFFQGRKDKLEDLHEHTDWPPLLIHGLGGAGKSTLISKFILEHLEDSEKGHIPFIYLDFDRPGISIREPLTLLFEGLRQLILQFPKEEKVLEEYRRGWEGDMLSTEQSQVRNIYSKGSTRSGERRYYLRDFETIWHSILQQTDVPLLFVLDSFEEVQYRATESDLIQLFDFLRDLSELVPRFRAVISGRSELPKIFETKKLFVGPFDKSAAIGYLAHKGIEDEELAGRIFDSLGGNPLNLTLATSVILKEMEEGNQSHDWLLLQMEGERIQELLFRRNLEHIHKLEVRNLAFPGLTVRQISPTVIQHILAAPCGLGEIGEQEAKDLFKELKRETFLVNIDEQGRFRFRPDLRKLLIDLVQKKDPERTRQIHNLAVTHYSKQNTPEARAEHVYHALRRGDDPASLRDILTPDLQPFLENSLSEFSPNNYLTLASVFKLEVPEAVRQQADLVFWEEKMISELEGFLSFGQVSSFPGMLERLAEKKKRTSTSQLRLLEGSFYELAGQLKKAFDVCQVALRDAEKHLVFEQQWQLHELLSRIEARQGRYAIAQSYSEKGVEVARQLGIPLQVIGLTLDIMHLRSRQGKPIGEVLDKLVRYVEEQDAALAKLFEQEYSMQKFIPFYNDAVPTLSFLRKHLFRFLPSDVWEEKAWPGTIAKWLEQTVKDVMIHRWLPAGRFEAAIQITTDQTGGDLEQLEKYTKDRLDVFLREVIPASVYPISVYDLVVFTELEGRVEELVEVYTAEEAAPEEPLTFDIFISYAHKDAEMKNELDKHLELLQRNAEVRFLSVDMLDPGMNVQEEIRAVMEKARMVLLLISPDYLESEFTSKEFRLAMKLAEEQRTRVVPIYLQPARHEALDKIQGLPRDGTPIAFFKDRDEAYNQIAVELNRIVSRLVRN